MTDAIAFALPGAEHLASSLSEVGVDRGQAEFRTFPDGETYVRLLNNVAGRRVVFIAALDNPDKRIIRLLLAAGTARDSGAREIGLAVPYLPYMRQDKAFQEGEPVSAAQFAKILCGFFDWIVTIDPHLHRFRTLEEIFGPTPAIAVSAMPALAVWINSEVHHPLIIGPDIESRQWVHALSKMIGATALVLEKKRTGDRAVSINVPEAGNFADLQPVIVDDIISTGRTMAELISGLLAKGFRAPVCCCVHALFTEEAETQMRDAGAIRVVSCDTVLHLSNKIRIGSLLADGVLRCLRGQYN